MNLSTRFTVALHILTLLAASGEDALTSQYIAGSVNTNPVVVRRVLGLLREKGFVTSQPGNSGGWKLARHAGSITLLDVRTAVNEGSPFSMHTNQPNPACPVGRNIQAALGAVYADAERAMEAELARTTIERLVRSVQRRAK